MCPACCVCVGLCSLGGMFSSLFRCSVLLMFPSMIGSQGRTFLMVFVLHGLYHGKNLRDRNIQLCDWQWHYKAQISNVDTHELSLVFDPSPMLIPSGPIANIQHNVQDVASSMGCNIDLQITHSKVMWRMLTEPYVQVVQEIVVSPDTECECKICSYESWKSVPQTSFFLEWQWGISTNVSKCEQKVPEDPGWGNGAVRIWLSW